MKTLIILMGSLCAVPALAQDLIVCDFTGTAPSVNRPWTQTSYIDPNLVFSGWDLGAGATAAEVDDAFVFSVSASTPESTLAEAIQGDEYLYFTLAPSTGTLDLSGKRIDFSIQRSYYHAPRKYSVFTSIDGFSEGSQLFTTAATGKSDFGVNDHSFIMPLSGYDGLTGPVEFRVYAYQAENSIDTTALTAFSVRQPGTIYTLALSSGLGGTATSDPEGTLFEAGTEIRLLAYPDPGYRFDGWSGDVTGLGNPRTILTDSDKTIAAGFAPAQPEAMRVGMNLTRVADWSTAWVFVDVFRMSREWLTRSVGGTEWDSGKRDEIPVDPDGWPTELPFLAASDGLSHFVHTLMPAPVSGEYTVFLEGAGRIEFTGAAQAALFTPSGGPSSYTLTVLPGDEGTLELKIRESSALDHIRNIRVVRPTFETTYESEPFHPEFLDRLGAFANLRFMAWGRTNASPLASWGERTTATSYTQTRAQGVSLEFMVALANELDQDLWICIPHAADDDYVAETARLLRDTVEPALKIYLEYSNETWNPSFGFPQTSYVQDQGEALGLDPDRWTAGQIYAALRSVQIWEIFESEFVDDSRLVKVLATQSANIQVTNLRVAALNDPSINPNYTMPDALALAPYFGDSYSPEDLPPSAPYPTVDEILDVAAPARIAELAPQLAAQKAVASLQGWTLICYEGGQNFLGVNGAEDDDTLTGILHDANRDLRMYTRYREYLDMLRSAGVEMFGNFSNVSAWSKWGSWGVLEYQDQPLRDAPKYRALVDWIANAECGDGVMEGAEECDDDGNAPCDGCSPECLLEQDTDGDEIFDPCDNCVLQPNLDQADADDDAVGDVCDNCVEVANPRDTGGGASATFTGNQLDSDADGYGNACDGDFNQSLPIIGFPDLAQMRQAMGKDRDSFSCPQDDGSSGGSCAEFDLNGDLSIIGFPDLARFRAMMGQAPGPKCSACPLPNLD